MADAVTVKEDEIFPLVEITRDSSQVSWREDQILLLTVNDTPELYEEGKTVELPGEVWTFTDREIKAWYPEHKEGVTDWTLRLSQLIGVPTDTGYTHVTAMWVRPKDVIRPAFLTDIESGTNIGSDLTEISYGPILTARTRGPGWDIPMTGRRKAGNTE